MPNHLENYNIVAVGDSEVWRQLSRELSRIQNGRLLRIPISLNPYIATDNYQVRAIFLLPDAVELYQGVCRAWIQRFRFGPNVNTPIVCIVEDGNQTNNDELIQLMRTNVVNWVLTPREITALLLLRAIHYSQLTIQRCLVTSAGQIVRHGLRRRAQTIEVRGHGREHESAPRGNVLEVTDNIVPSAPVEYSITDTRSAHTMNLDPRDQTTSTNGVVSNRTDTNSADVNNSSKRACPDPQVQGEVVATHKKSRTANEGLSLPEGRSCRVMLSRLSVTSPPPTSQSPAASSRADTSEPTAQALVAGRKRNSRKTRRRGRAHNKPRSALTRGRMVDGVNKMNTEAPSTASRGRLHHKAADLNDKLDMAMIYISRVQSLLDGETTSQM